MFEGIEITWYGYVIAGFCLGAYIHSHRTRHIIHWLIIKVLRGFIWMLQRADYYYKEPKTRKSKPASVPPVFADKKDGIEVGDEELKKWLAKNPELSVVER